MNALTIAFKDTRLRFRDPAALLLMIAAPLILMSIIVAAFSDPNVNNKSTSIEYTIVLVNNSHTTQGEALLEELKTELSSVTLTTVDNLESASRMLDKGNVDGVIEIPNGFNDSLTYKNITSSNTPLKTIDFHYLPTFDDHPQKTIIKKLLIEKNKILLTINALRTHTSKRINAPGFDIKSFVTNSLDRLKSIKHPTISLKTQNDRQDTIRVLSETDELTYLIIGLMIFFLFFAMFDNINSLLSERKQSTLSRLIVSGTSVGVILFSKVAGAFIIGVIQVFCLITASTILFGIDWFDSIPGLLLMIIATITAITSLGICISAFSRDIKHANVLAGTIVLVFGALGGSFYHPHGFPDWLHHISYLTMNRWAIDGLVGVVTNELTVLDILQESGVLISTALILFLIGFWKLSHTLGGNGR